MLKDELLNDPLSRGYSSMTDEQAKDSLNTLNRPVLGSANRSQFTRWSARNDAISRLEADTGSTKAISKAVLFLMTGDRFIDFTDPEISQMVDALVTGAVFTRNEMNDLKTLATKTISRAEELNLPRVREGHVKGARA